MLLVSFVREPGRPVSGLLLLALLAGCGDAASDGSDTGNGDTGGDVTVDTGDTSDAAIDGSGDAGNPDASDSGDTTDATSDAIDDNGGDVVASRCGDGVRSGAEECDNGDANSNSTPNACRIDCRAAYCGDGVIDDGEQCDDANRFGGDGCTPTCGREDGPAEREPNNTLATAQAVSNGETVIGSLPARDSDCYAIEVREPGWVSATITRCEGDTSMRLFSPAGTVIASNDDASPGSRCSAIVPETSAGARYLASGTYVVCIEGFLGSAVASYNVNFATDDDACEPGRFSVDTTADLDGDLIADACDDDDDNDDVPDVDDNCPRIANNNTPLAIAPAADGTVRGWLVAGPYSQTPPVDCMPNDFDYFDGSEEPIAPEVGTPAGVRVLDGPAVAWRSYLDNDAQIDLTTVGWTSSAPRAAYAFVYVWAPEATSAELRFGSDDGARVWFNDIEVFATGTCRGVVVDDDIVPVELVEGENRLLLKVHDNGGGWGLRARLVDLEGNPIPALTYGRSADAGAIDNQNDADDDGVGDVCDVD